MKRASSKDSPNRRKQSRRPDSSAIRRKRLTMGAVVMALVVVVWLDHSGLWGPGVSSVNLAPIAGVTVRVIRVVDGDTFIADLPDPLHSTPTTRVRIWGIDSPELARQGKPAQPFAQAAARFAKDRLEGQRVWLTTEPTRVRGYYGRLLAHVQMDNGDLFSEEILRAGLARADDRWPHRWLDRLAIAAQEGRDKGVGIWSS